MRSDQRPAEQLRPITLTPHYLEHPEGSVMIEAGRTRVICTASVEDRVPPFLRNTARDGSRPSTACCRAPRARGRSAKRARASRGTHQEIQRLIGRSLRAVTNLPALGERTVDRLRRHPGRRRHPHGLDHRRVHRARPRLRDLRKRDTLKTIPLSDHVAAISVGIVDGEPLLDLAYEDDHAPKWT
jgi:ribonuclease PH